MTDTLKVAEKEVIQQSVTAPFLLRVGGLPIDVVDSLSFPETASWAESVLVLEQRLAEKKEEIADALGAAVPRYPEDRAVRRKLINLRRDIFNLREAGYGTEGKAFAETLASPERECLLEWVELWETYAHLLRTGQALFERELVQKRACLKKIAEIADFRKGLALASPLLANALDAYLSTDNLHLNHSLRTVERSLVEYLLRTACKTSPFSTFTAVCPGTFDDQATKNDPDVMYQIASMEKKSFTRLNVVVLSRLSACILAAPQIRPDLLVSMTPGWHIVDGRIRYLRKMQNVEDERGEATFSLDIIHENVFYLPVGPLLQTLIDLIGNGHRVRFHELVAQLTDLSDSQSFATQDQVSTYLEHLLHLGLLIVPDIQLNLHSKYPLKHYRQGLLALQIPALENIATHLGTLDMLVQTYATALSAQRHELLEAIRQEVRACYSELGQTSVTLPKMLLYEDTTLRPQKLAINQTSWQNILTSVAEFQGVLPLFDANLFRRLVTEGYFQARYGAGQQCDDFLAFAYEFRQRFFEHYLKSSFTLPNSRASKKKSPLYLNYFQQSSITLLERSQHALIDYISQAYRDLPAEGNELTLGDDFIEQFAPYVPESISHFSSYTFFSQFARVNGEAMMMINRIYNGLTVMFSRFEHFFDEEEGYDLVREIRSAFQRLQPAGAVFAEMKGGYNTTNLNFHPQVTPYELVCPGDLSSRTRDEQIPLEDLALQHDAEEGRLRLYSKRLGKEVIPVYLGFLLPTVLPELQQVLLNFAIAPRCQINLWKDVPVVADTRGVQSYPRLSYKQIVLQRAQWKFPPDVFPQRASGQSDADFFLTMARWRQKYHLPSRVFVTPARDGETIVSRSAPARKEPEENMPTYKPLYVDFENAFSLTLLEATVRGFTHGIVMTEMLPHRDHLWLQHDNQSYVSEFVWEMNSVRRGHHG
jgi:hypothetical protein